jgi:hypothetical protein
LIGVNLELGLLVKAIDESYDRKADTGSNQAVSDGCGTGLVSKMLE